MHDEHTQMLDRDQDSAWPETCSINVSTLRNGAAGLILNRMLIRKAGNEIMNRTLLKDVMARLAGSMAIVLLAMGVFGSQHALAGISATKHNLGSTGTGVNKFDGTGEICVFCHTPHGADTSAAVPLWNRVLALPNTYTTYNSLGTSSLDGATAPVGSVSLACLSCHDGTQAMNVMINAPGSGLTGDATFTGGTWAGANQTLGKIGAGLITNIGTDLKNDHPVGIQYGGGMPAGGAYTAGAIAAGALKDADFKALDHATLNGNSVWWVDTGTAGRQKTDMALYTRTGADSVTYPGGVRTVTAGGLAGAQAFVECASCHDPHTDVNPTFLRIANAGSAVCLACHIK
ncbi:MAG: cytochrome c3 family protein [Oxalobacteraceae bacterium]|nr:cytochrome c3 family protein [Oxalobacteraceae bacterium]